MTAKPRPQLRLTIPITPLSIKLEEVDDKMFIVMEYVEGQELRQLVKTLGSVPFDDAITYAIQIAEGLNTLKISSRNGGAPPLERLKGQIPCQQTPAEGKTSDWVKLTCHNTILKRAKKMNKERLKDYLSYLRLPALRQCYQQQATIAERQQLPISISSKTLLEEEVLAKKERAAQIRIHTAKFPVVKTLEQFSILLSEKIMYSSLASPGLAKHIWL